MDKFCTNRDSDFFKLYFRNSVCARKNKKCLAHIYSKILEDITDKCYFVTFPID